MATERQLRLVQASWARLSPLDPRAASLFSDRLVKIDPALGWLMPSRFTSTAGLLASLVDSVLDSHDEVSIDLAGYYLIDQDYVSIGAALLWTLARVLGDAYTPDVADAWEAAVASLTGSPARAPRRELVSMAA